MAGLFNSMNKTSTTSGGGLFKNKKKDLERDGRNRFTPEEIQELNDKRSFSEKSKGGKILEAITRIPTSLAKKDVQQTIRQPVWNAIDTVSKAHDVFGAGMRAAAFGDTQNVATGGIAPTTGNEAADKVLRTVGGISSIALPSGGGGPSMFTPVRQAAETAAGKILPKAASGIAKAGKIALTGAFESLPYTAQQIFIEPDKNLEEILKTTGSNLLLGVAGELGSAGVGKLFKSIGNKLKSGKPLTAQEQAIVNEVKKEVEVKAKTLQGTYKSKNKALEKATATTAPLKSVDNIQTPSKEIKPEKSAQKAADNFKSTSSRIDLPENKAYIEKYSKTLPDSEAELLKIMDDLTQQAKVEKNKSKMIEIDLQFFAVKEKLGKVSKSYSNTLKNTDAIPQKVKDMLDESDFIYDPITEKEQLFEARKRIRADAEGELKRIQDLSRTAYSENDINVGMELLSDISNKADLSEADILNIKKTAKGVSQAGRTSGRGVQAFAKYTRTKEGVITATQKVVDKVEDEIRKTNPNLWKRVQKEADDIVKKSKIDGKVIDPDRALSLAKKKYNIPDLTEDDILGISKLLDDYKKAAEGSREQKEAWQKAMKIMASKIPPTAVDKFKGLQRISYLLNPKTILVRNPSGNAIMNIAETIKDLPGAMVDTITSKVRGSSRTTLAPSLDRFKAQAKGLKEGFKDAVKDIKAGVDTSPTIGMLEMPKVDVFDNNKALGRFLNKLDKKVGQALQLGDRPFYQAAFEERMSDLVKIRGSEITQEMIDEASDFALERVFQNNTGMSRFFSALKNPPKNAPVGVKTTWGFITNGIIPFSKTPANVLNKLLEYSPVGLAKAVGHGVLTKAGKTVFNQKYFVDNIARSLTGTGLALLGYAMAAKGLIKGKTDKDKDVAALERLMGINPYSIVIDGKSYTFDWAQPIGSVLAAGADAYFSGMNKENFSQQLGAALQGYGNTFFNQSMMQNLTNFLDTYNPISGVVRSVANTSNIMSPTLAAQAARTIDPYVRDTSADSAIMEQVNKIIARTPVLSTTLPKKVDVLGNEQKQSQGRDILFRAFEQFISPGYFGDTDKASDTMSKIYEVYMATDNKNVFPKLAPESFSRTVKGEKEKINLTAEQKREWQRLSGKYYSEKFSARTAGKTTKAKEKALEKLANEAYEYAKKKLLTQQSR